ncbi:hypothetical protein CLV72_105255 [Allonocardiopsis opalescens]|uniref:Uncharacterized protein n=1 Tax=Allonocardiopsis opalescens TaxID=1144618 RepID=A0A2T0Q269_9ACTN|nr:hypothetical protein CLV72_105255 [Allonocardiopsis opalescens]
MISVTSSQGKSFWCGLWWTSSPTTSPSSDCTCSGGCRILPWVENTWPIANPALGDFLGLEKFRQVANDARNAPEKENAFRQFHLNQWVRQATRWMPMHLYDASAGTVWQHPDQERG